MWRRILQDNGTAIAQRWLLEIFDSYPPETAKFLKKQKDPHANPVGHTLRICTAGICESLFAETLDAEAVCTHLMEIIKVRAVQDMAPARALSFIFLLRNAVRAETGGAATPEILALADERVDQAALFAFDIYVKCREQMYQLRVNEVKRNVSVIIEKFNKENCGVDPEPEESGAGETLQQPIARCEA